MDRTLIIHNFSFYHKLDIATLVRYQWSEMEWSGVQTLHIIVECSMCY